MDAYTLFSHEIFKIGDERFHNSREEAIEAMKQTLAKSEESALRTAAKFKELGDLLAR